VAYVSLYRKYRPQAFEELCGQQHVATTLANAVSTARIHHAYLFTGPRGTGKTSTARILAKALNCESGPTSTPCNTCTHCQAITAGTSIDVIEIDAASHGGVDDVRDLRDRVPLGPASARMKVYIVDECHMLSTAGWNAFLKTVEEPPGHVVFIFATTEPHKVLPTILSRTQRFDFKRLSAADLAAHVEAIGAREGLAFEPGAVELVVRAGDGSVRDTLSVLDQAVAFTGPKVTLSGVANVLGAVADQVLADLADRIAAGDAAGLLVAVGRLADAGQDLRQLARDAVEHLRSLLLLQAAPDARLVETTPERLDYLVAQAGRLGRVELIRAIELLTDAQVQMRRGNTRLPLEIALVKAAMPEACGDVGALGARLERLERSASVAATAPARGPQADCAGPHQPASPDRADLLPTAAGATHATPPGVGLDAVRNSWPAVLEAAKRNSRKLGAMLTAGQPVALDGDDLTVQFSYAFHAESCSTDQARASLRTIFAELLGEPLMIRAVVADAALAVSTSADPQPTDETEAVLEAEAAEASGELPDAPTAHALALETLTRDLGATILEQNA
jgi:DNA polymerase III subunit gamma/tau